MRKFLALLAILTLLASPAALAETVTAEKLLHGFDVTLVIPEGYVMTEETDNQYVYVCIKSDEQGTPDFDITVAHSEEYDGITINDLGAEEKLRLVDLMDDDFMEPVVQQLVTEHGTEVYLINEASPESTNNFASGFSIYKGYFVQIYAAKPNYEKLSQEDLDLAVKILSDMWFVEK